MTAPVVAEKACTKCGEVKPADQFYRRAASRDGLSYFCRACHQSYYKGKRPRESFVPLPGGEKRCRACEQMVKAEDFYSHRFNADGLQSRCKACCQERAKARTITSRRAYNFMHLYGITLEEYDNMLTVQDNRCAICHTPAAKSTKGRLVVDHCHDTGIVRGLLCGKCNQGLGSFKDSAARLAAARRYLANPS